MDRCFLGIVTQGGNGICIVPSLMHIFSSRGFGGYFILSHHGSVLSQGSDCKPTVSLCSVTYRYVTEE